MNVKEWAAATGVSYATARRRYESGTLPVSCLPPRSAGHKPDLDRQVARVTGWATGQRLGVGRVVTEVGSALNGHRKRFLALLCDPSVSTVVVEHRARRAVEAVTEDSPA